MWSATIRATILCDLELLRRPCNGEPTRWFYTAGVTEPTSGWRSARSVGFYRDRRRQEAASPFTSASAARTASRVIATRSPIAAFAATARPALFRRYAVIKCRSRCRGRLDVQDRVRRLVRCGRLRGAKRLRRGLDHCPWRSAAADRVLERDHGCR